MLPLIDTIVAGVTKVIDKIVPDANVREQVKLALQQESLEWSKLENADRDSARKREMEVKDSTPRYGFYLLSFGFYGVLGYMLVSPLPPGSERVIDIMLGSLGTAWTAAVYYYYGTSHGSAEKTSIIDRVVNHKDPS
jgi:hypothetical protein